MFATVVGRFVTGDRLLIARCVKGAKHVHNAVFSRQPAQLLLGSVHMVGDLESDTGRAAALADVASPGSISRTALQ